MDIDKLDNSEMDYDSMDIISEMELPLDVSPDEIRTNLVIAARYLGGYKAMDDKLERLKEQKATVMDWFKTQKEAIEKQQDFIKSKMDEALYAAEVNGEKKPKIKTWAGTAYYQTRDSFDWNGVTNTDNRAVAIAKKHGLEIEVIEKTDLGQLKQVLTDQEKAELGVKVTNQKSVVIRKA